MRKTAIGWSLIALILLFSVQLAVGDQKIAKPLDLIGGTDDIGNIWELTDWDLSPLDDGDLVMAIWAGADGAIDPPVTAQGSPYNGLPTGDDVFLWVMAQPYWFVEYASFAVTIASWDVGVDLDSLGRQRHPTPGEKVYARVFNTDDLSTATYYGDSNPHKVLGYSGEVAWLTMPNDPPGSGPTTDQAIYGRFFKVIGGINPATQQTFKLRDPSADLEDGDRVQLIWAGADGQIDIPHPMTRMPSGDDQLITRWGVNEGMLPATNTSVFRKFSASFDSANHGLPAENQQIYVRLFNAQNPLEATYYGDSDLYQVQYVIGESLNVFTDAAVDCDTQFPPSDVRDLTISGGWDPVLYASVPLKDVYGLQLMDGDQVHILWAGPDGLIDPMDEITGGITGDDSLLVDGVVGDGIAGTDLSRFEYALFSYEAHKKGGFPAQGDVVYARLFDDPTIGQDSPAKWYGESEPDTVEWIFDEKMHFFADTLFDATIRAPWFRSIKIYGGTDTSLVEHPLADSSGAMLADGDLVQIIWAGPNGTIDPMSTSDCLPGGDDSLAITIAIGEEYGAGTGLFKTEIQTWATHVGGLPAKDDVLYLRVFNDSQYKKASHYGESIIHTVAYEQGEAFYVFDDDADDCVIPNPCFSTSVEWADPAASLPTEYTLFQNFPNPFNPETDIRYQIPRDGQVELVIYNVLGQKICTLVDGYRAAGHYTVRWFGTDSMGREMGSGIYFYRLRSGDFSAVRKMVLMK